MQVLVQYKVHYEVWSIDAGKYERYDFLLSAEMTITKVPMPGILQCSDFCLYPLDS